VKAVRRTITRGWRRFGKITLSDCKGHFEDAGIPHKIDELLDVVGLPTDIDAILDSTGDSETALTPSSPHPPISPMRLPTSRLSSAV
jgi:hypothetical protein